MRIKKALSVLLVCAMMITTGVIPASAASVAFMPQGPNQTYILKITASQTISSSISFAMGTSFSINSEALGNGDVSISSSSGTAIQGKVLDGDYTPTLNGSKITSNTISFGISNGTDNSIAAGAVGKFTWIGYVQFTDNTKHPQNDLGLTMSNIKFAKNVTLGFTINSKPESVMLTESIVGEVIPQIQDNSLVAGSQLDVRTYINDGKGFSKTQQEAMRNSKSANFTVTATLSKAIVEDIMPFTLITDLNSTSVPCVASKGATSIKFTVPKEYFYEEEYTDFVFSWLKISGGNGKYGFTNVILEYDGTSTGSTGSTGSDAVDEFMINYKAVKLNVGSNLMLKTNYEDVTWRTSSSALVRVFTNGKIIAVKAGTATITGTNENNDKVTCKVTVTNSTKPVTTIKLSKSSGTVYQNSSYDIAKMMSVNPSSHTDGITWSSSDTNIATVSSAGKVKVLDTGDVTITVTASSGKSASILLKCKAPAIKLSKSSATISVGKTTTIGATSMPSSSTITYESYNEGVATVTSKGVVKGVKAGTAKIIVKNKNGGSATFTVTVK